LGTSGSSTRLCCPSSGRNPLGKGAQSCADCANCASIAPLVVFLVGNVAAPCLLTCRRVKILKF
jgi:hypothetical protein